jgi:hypothetical protein
VKHSSHSPPARAVGGHHDNHNTTDRGRAERISRARSQANAVTYVIATIATTASLTGMWPVIRTAVITAGVTPELVTPLSLTALGLLEGTIIACGIRVRANVLERGERGADGVGLWVAVGASSLISAAEAALAAPPGTPAGQHFVTVLVRLIAPVTAGWLWERGLTPERRAAGRDEPGVLTIYLARLRAGLLARVGSTDPAEVGRQRAATRAARLSERLRGADEQQLTFRQRSALRRLRKAVHASGAAHDAEARRYLLDDIAATRNVLTLARIHPPSPWGNVPRHRPSAEPDRVVGAQRSPGAASAAKWNRDRGGNPSGSRAAGEQAEALFPVEWDVLPDAERAA